ncbi:hypothetical protein FVEG_16094 [Fusarium verticillioides 7600]|uniref:Uncharacterized protein n=1 Tax=Gibberella moniliformis (strain M3125 / FGSC 7600) TaxID=334819 RepID=W7M6Q9_GIBM7|nr:hypothetical protein FVEG_16094 [Fusarium verticillioides 7600]EWG47268.1 hypothetical protein FVEG_16094 [Fusarium verticillioides 7600]
MSRHMYRSSMSSPDPSAPGLRSLDCRSPPAPSACEIPASPHSLKRLKGVKTFGCIMNDITWMPRRAVHRSFRATRVTEHTSIIFRFEFLSRLRNSLRFDLILCLDHMVHPLTLLADLQRRSNSTDHLNDKLYQPLKHRGIFIKRLNTFEELFLLGSIHKAN